MLLFVCWTASAAVLAGPGESDWGGCLAVGQNSDGRLELFKTNPKGTIVHRWQQVPNGVWSPWANLRGAFADGIAVRTNLEGKLELFAVDKATRELKYTEQKIANGREWEDWIEDVADAFCQKHEMKSKYLSAAGGVDGGDA